MIDNNEMVIGKRGWNKYLIERIYYKGNESDEWKLGIKPLLKN